MRKSIKILTIILLSSVYYSCGHKSVETDKHKDFKFFPESSNSKFKVEKMPYWSHKQIAYDDNYYYSECNVGNNKQVYYGGLVIYNKNFEEIHKILGYRGKITADGLIYNIPYVPVGTTDTIYKYSGPSYKPVVIDLIDTDEMRDKILKKYADQIKKMDAIDSTRQKARGFYDVEYKKELVDKITPESVISYVILKDYYILKYKNKEQKAISRYSFIPTEYNLKEEEEPKKLELSTDNKSLERFNTAILGNNSSGNHFVFGYSQFGLDYYQLKSKTDSTFFKYNNNQLSRPVLKELESPIKGKLLLEDSYTRELFWVTYMDK